MVNVTIDGVQTQVEKGTTVLHAAQKVGVNIPTLCYLEGINQIGACRVCLVEIEGARALQPACVYPCTDGLKVHTNTAKVRESRKTVVELLLSDHPADCLTCVRSGKCELQSISKQLGIKDVRFYGDMNFYDKDDSSIAISRDKNKCILCRRCIAACTNVQGVNIWGMMDRGFGSHVDTVFGESLDNTNCTLCGQCVNACPVGALTDKNNIPQVWDAIADTSKVVVAQFAPSVRVTIGEEFGLPMGTVTTGKIISALRLLGFDKVFDTNWSADLTIMEEGHELLHRLTTGQKLPMITTCSPGWIKFAEHHFPEQLDHLSTAKSPQAMFGTMVKTYYAQMAGIDPATIYSVSIMPCSAKKFECNRPELRDSGYQDVDVVITVREFARMIKEAGIDFAALPDGEADNPLGVGTGAATIFGATGGVMEAALRTVYEVVTGETLEKLDFNDVRGFSEGIKEATVTMGETTVKVAVAHGLKNARAMMERVARGEANEYALIELMACPGGCVGGGGTPQVDSLTRSKLPEDFRALRAHGLYEDDLHLPLRKSHENPYIQEIYANFLGAPLSEKAHHLLHTSYTPRVKYICPEE